MESHSHPLLTRLAASSAPEVFAAGERLYQAHAVLDLARSSRRVFVARVADAVGSPERVRVSLSPGVGAVSGCSCGTQKLCRHAVAALFEFCARGVDLPEELEHDWRPPAGSVPVADSDDPADNASESSPPPSRPGSLPAFPSTRQMGRGNGPVDVPRLLLTLPDTPLVLPDRWSRLTVGISIRYQRRAYAALNIRRLVDSGRAAGSMQFEAFSAQARAIMRFLVTRGDTTAEGVTLVTSDAVDFLRLVSGHADTWVGDRRLRIHSELPPLALASAAVSGSERLSVVVGLLLAGSGFVRPPAWSFLVGACGFWIGFRENFWWLPPVVDGRVLHTFLDSSDREMSPTELAEVVADWRRHGVALATLSRTTDIAPVVSRAVPCRPWLYLDWEDAAVSARVEFEYDNIRLAPDQDMPLAAGLLERDKRAEKTVLELLASRGFEPAPATPGASLRLRDPDQLWDFWREGVDALPADWKLFLAPAFLRARSQAGLLDIEIDAGKEGESWFDLDIRFLSQGGRRLTWNEVSAASAGGRQTFLVDGTLLHIPAELRHMMELIRREASADSDSRLRFHKFSAPALANALAGRLSRLRADWVTLGRRLTAPITLDETMFSEDLGRILRGYQKEGVMWLRLLEESGFHGILADEMGLGKTVQALALLAWRKRTQRSRHPSLVICPSSLMENWRNETLRFVPDVRPLLIWGLQRDALFRKIRGHDLIITSYALMRRDAKRYRRLKFDYVILDEAQHIKNPQTVNARNCKQLQAAHRLILTGTPMENAARELWSLFDFILPGYLRTRPEFSRRYETSPSGSSLEDQAREELAARIRPFLLRRRKADVCQELPPKLEQAVFCEMDERQARLYSAFLLAGRQALAEAREVGWRQRRFHVLALLTRLRQVCCHPMLLPPALREPDHAKIASAKTDLLQEMLLENIDSGHRVIIFSQFVAFLKLFEHWLEKQKIRYEYLDGSTTERQSRVDRFNRDDTIPVFLLSLRAGGTGLNLTGADTVIHYDQWWNPMVEDQATDRTHRIGQTRQVTSVKLMVRSSVEEKVHQLQQRKRQLFNQLMMGVPTRTGELTIDDVAFLLEDQGPVAAGPAPRSPTRT